MPHPKEAREPLTRLSGAGHQTALLDRTDEGRRVAAQLLALRGQIAVLHGREGSGKTKFVRSNVIPSLPPGILSCYGQCSPELPESFESALGALTLAEAVRSDGFIFLDSFDWFLNAAIPSRRQALAPVLSGRTATLVLVVSDQKLGELLAIRSIEPGIMDHLIETGEMSLSEGLAHIADTIDRTRLFYPPDLVTAIEADLETFSPGRRALTPELVVQVDSYFRRLAASPPGKIDVAHFDSIGRLRGILESDLQARLALAPVDLRAEDGAVLRAVLAEVVGSRMARRSIDLAEPARRLALDPAIGAAALAWLEEQGTVRESGSGTLEIAPSQLEQVIAETLEQKRRNTRDAKEMLARGLDGWIQMHAALTPTCTAGIHAVRADLAVTDGEAGFLVQCALRSGETGDEWAKYWLGRIPKRDQQIAAAFEALFDSDPSVRARAAALLAAYDEPEVRGQLYRTAVEDPDEEVRRHAVSALRGMQVTEFWEPLAVDARLPSSRYREAAVEALCLFHDSRTVNLLKDLVFDPVTPEAIRAKAIRTLAKMDFAGAAEALVDIALSDEDESDREHAAAALAASPTRDFASSALNALRRSGAGPVQQTSRGGWWLAQWTSAVPLALLAGFANLFLHGTALIAIRRYRIGIALLAAEAAVIAALATNSGPGWIGWLLAATLLIGSWLPVKTLIERRSRLETRLGTFPGLLALGLYAGSVFTLFFLVHGLAHLFAGRTRTAIRIFGLQLLAVVCGALWFADQQTYGLTRVGPFYQYIGIALWAATWLLDVIPVAYFSLLAPERAIAGQRRREAYTRLLSNAAAAGRLLDLAESSDVKDRKWARSILRKCADCVVPLFWVTLLRTRGAGTPGFVDQVLRKTQREETIREIQALWSGGDPGMRERFFRILAWSPTELSLKYLSMMRAQLSFGYRLRYYFAVARFRLTLVPGIVWIALLLCCPMAVSLAYHGWKYGSQPAALAKDFVNSLAAQDKEPDRVVKFAKFVAEAYPEKIDQDLVIGLGRILGTGEEGLSAASPEAGPIQVLGRRHWEARIRAAQQLADLTQSRLPRIPPSARQQLQINLQVLEAALMWSDLQPPFDIASRRSLLAALEVMATPPATGPQDVQNTSKAVDALKNFALRGSASWSADRVESGSSTGRLSGRSDLQGLQVEAVRILGRIPSTKASAALDELAGTTGPAQYEANNQRRQTGAVLLESVRGAYQRSEYSQAIERGMRVLPLLSPEDSDSRAELLLLVGKSNWRLASVANADPKQADDLDRAAVQSIEDSQKIRPLDQEALRVLASCYSRISERLIPKDQNEALIYSRKAVQYDDSYPEAHGTLALVLSSQGDQEAAIAALDDAVRLEPRYAWAYCQQASIRLDQRRYADALNYAGKAIEADSGYSWSYTLLSETYHREGKDRQAIEALARLRQQFPDNPWPVGAQMYVYHENLSAVDPSAYQKNYALYLELQQPNYLPHITKPDDMEAGFVEANLTTGRYQEAAERGAKLLERTKATPDSGLSVPVRLIVYAALALKGDFTKAGDALDALESVLQKLPANYKSEWSFQGTLRYIRASNASEPLKTRLANLVEAVDKDPLHVPPALLKENQEAVKRNRLLF